MRFDFTIYADNSTELRQAFKSALAALPKDVRLPEACGFVVTPRAVIETAWPAAHERRAIPRERGRKATASVETGPVWPSNEPQEPDVVPAPSEPYEDENDDGSVGVPASD
jgi:hypothetical protein